jgi:hypothetical protein
MLSAAGFFVCSILGGFSNEIKTLGGIRRHCTVPERGRLQEESGRGATTSAASGEFDGFEYSYPDDDDRATSNSHSGDTQ